MRIVYEITIANRKILDALPIAKSSLVKRIEDVATSSRREADRIIEIIHEQFRALLA